MCKEYGADVAINYKTQDFAVEVLSATADRGIIIMFYEKYTVDLEIFVYRNFRMINFRVKIFS